MQSTSDGMPSDPGKRGTSTGLDRPNAPSNTPGPHQNPAAEQVAQASGSMLQQVRARLEVLSTAPLDDHPAGFAALHAQLTDALAAVADS